MHLQSDNKSCSFLVLVQTAYPFYRQLVNELSLYDIYKLAQSCSLLRRLLKPLLKKQSLIDGMFSRFVLDVREFRRVLQASHCFVYGEFLYEAFFKLPSSLADTCSQSISRQSMQIVSIEANSMSRLVPVLLFLLSQGYRYTEHNGVSLPMIFTLDCKNGPKASSFSYVRGANPY